MDQNRKSYTSKSRSRAIQVREELQNLSKGNISIADYILESKIITN